MDFKARLTLQVGAQVILEAARVRQSTAPALAQVPVLVPVLALVLALVPVQVILKT